MSFYHALKSKVANRGIPPDSFLDELLAWGRTAPDALFAPNDGFDVYSSVADNLGPWTCKLHRKAVMIEVLRVLAGFESSWNWNEGRDTTNASSITPETIEAGAWQVSANSRHFGADLMALAPADGRDFQFAMKTDHRLACEYIARLLRHTVNHNGPVKRKEINPHLHREAVSEAMALLA